MKKFFSGVCTAIVTPFKNGKVDLITFERLINYQIDSGVDALCILGTTGEASTLTHDEKIEIVRLSLRVIAARVPIIFGIGGNNPAEIIKFGLEINKLVKSCAPSNIAVLVTAPYYNKCTQDAAVKYFHDISEAVKLPTIVYNIPGRTGMNLETATIAKIAKFRYIAGVKEASGNITQIADIVRLCPNISVYSGDDALAVPAYAVGCRGVISVLSNVRPHETCAIWLNRYKARGLKLFQTEMPYIRALFCEISPGPVKYAMYLLGLCSPEVRPPLTQPTKTAIMAHGFRELFKPTCNR